jgi:TonB family protein
MDHSGKEVMGMPAIQDENGEWEQRPTWAAVKMDIRRGHVDGDRLVRGESADADFDRVAVRARQHPALRALFPNVEDEVDENGFIFGDETPDSDETSEETGEAPACPALASASAETRILPSPRSETTIETPKTKAPKYKAPKPKREMGQPPVSKTQSQAATPPKEGRGRPVFLLLFLLLAAGGAMAYFVVNSGPSSTAATPAPRSTVKATPEPAPAEVVAPTGYVRARRETAPKPTYPAASLDRAISGRVALEYSIDARGVTRNILVTSSPDPALSAAALEAMRAWRYTPARRGGEAVAIESTTHSFSFAPSAEDVATIDRRGAARREAFRPETARPTPSTSSTPKRQPPVPEGITPTTSISRTPSSIRSNRARPKQPLLAKDDTVPTPTDRAPTSPLQTEILPIERAPPIMPARAARSGHCEVAWDLALDGSTRNVRTLSCSQSLFREASIDAVRKWTYEPVTDANRHLSRNNITYTITFRLRDERGRIIPE